MSVTSLVLNVLNKYPVKRLIILLFVSVNFSIVWYISTEAPPLKERCSFKYPEFSRILDHPVTLPDGGVMSGDGEVFPVGEWWSEDSIIRGCPCSGEKTCVSKCCPLGQALEGHYCVDSIWTDKFEKNLMFHWFRRKNTTKHFSVWSVGCDGFYDLPRSRNPIEYIMLYPEISNSYCFEVNNKFGEYDIMVFGCNMPEDEHQWEEFKAKIKMFLVRFLYVLFLVVNLFTLGVFTLLPKLRKGYGPSIMCYVAVLCLKNMFSLSFTWDWAAGRWYQCISYASISLSIFLSTTAWQVVIAHQLWSLFSAGAGVANAANRSENTKRFLVYSALAWGLSLLVIVLMVTMYLLPGAPQFLKPQFDPESCTPKIVTRFLYVIGPCMLGYVVTIILCAATLRRLAAFRKTSEALQNHQSRRHNAKKIQWSDLYAKVCFLMGMCQLTANLIELTNWMISLPPSILTVTDTVNIMVGAEVFFILVCKREILSSLLQRIKSLWRRSTQNF